MANSLNNLIKVKTDFLINKINDVSNSKVLNLSEILEYVDIYFIQGAYNDIDLINICFDKTSAHFNKNIGKTSSNQIIFSKNNSIFKFDSLIINIVIQTCLSILNISEEDFWVKIETLASENNLIAKFILGSFSNDYYITKNHIELLFDSAKNGYNPSWCKLGNIFSNCNFECAIKIQNKEINLLKTACETYMGAIKSNRYNSFCKYRLGIIYLQRAMSASTSEQSKELCSNGIYWINKSANENYPLALDFIGVCYASGNYLNKNFDLASKYFEKSSELGYNVSQKNFDKLNKQIKSLNRKLVI